MAQVPQFRVCNLRAWTEFWFTWECWLFIPFGKGALRESTSTPCSAEAAGANSHRFWRQPSLTGTGAALLSHRFWSYLERRNKIITSVAWHAMSMYMSCPRGWAEAHAFLPWALSTVLADQSRLGYKNSQSGCLKRNPDSCLILMIFFLMSLIPQSYNAHLPFDEGVKINRRKCERSSPPPSTKAALNSSGGPVASPHTSLQLYSFLFCWQLGHWCHLTTYMYNPCPWGIREEGGFASSATSLR